MNQKVELPDLEQIGKFAGEIRRLTELSGFLEIKIKVLESEINKIVTSDEKYFINGKPPSQAYIDSTFKFTGLDGGLVKLREDLAKTQADLEYFKLMYKYLLLMIDIWRTQQASERLISA